VKVGGGGGEVNEAVEGARRDAVDELNNVGGN